MNQLKLTDILLNYILNLTENGNGNSYDLFKEQNVNHMFDFIKGKGNKSILNADHK